MTAQLVHPPQSAVTARRALLTTALGRYYLQLALVVELIVLAAVVPNFGSTQNLRSIALQGSFAGIVACGETLLIAGGLFDLSVAGLMALGAIATAYALPHVPAFVALLAGLGVSTAAGLANGLIVTRIRVPTFIATLGMMNVCLAIAFIWTHGDVVIVTSPFVVQFANGTILGLPIVFVVFAAICVAGYALLQRTYFGRTMRAIGSSEAAATMAGLPIVRTKVLGFAISGLLAGVAAVALSGLLSTASGDMAMGYELSAIAVAVVGGTALSGGRGTFLGTFTGALFFATLDDALNLLNVASYWQHVVAGGLLVLALALGASATRGTDA